MTRILSVALLHNNLNARTMKKAILKTAIILASLSSVIACNSTKSLTLKNQEKMFTVEQIKEAHSKVKSGAEFPSYIREIKKLGVTHYEAYVTDGHINYHGANNYTAKAPAKYEPLVIAEISKDEEFKKELIEHQQGKTDFLTFIKMCATFGIEKWEICMDKMTCTYYDKAGNEILVEQIPQ
ncbi:uncharacterized protein YbcV (DUF1398 family) [Flavobacterium arsenatis]|uniref:Uncharacterized protein YbcV (DUF1398 family) n=1 Tax=Flavobacterium arsenatis TaxID=1484332 RepID=A0ABU1TNV4_9FLAO|nr:DUF1398 family protein [Flavobacterium arsenatis]MDR6967640.1 uncharacterized protein YbcV (DUF1398 family) [Flavobacterium arsenatis]